MTARLKKKTITNESLDNQTMLSIQKVEMLDTEFDEDGNALRKEPPKSARTHHRGQSTNEALYNLNGVIE